MVDQTTGRLGIRRIKKGGSFERNHGGSWGARHCWGEPFTQNVGQKKQLKNLDAISYVFLVPCYRIRIEVLSQKLV